MAIIMKSNQFDYQIKIGLQEQADRFQSAADTDIAFEKVMLDAEERKKDRKSVV